MNEPGDVAWEIPCPIPPVQIILIACPFEQILSYKLYLTSRCPALSERWDGQAVFRDIRP